MKIVIQLSVNETFKSIDDSKVYRLLWIDEGNVIIYLIDVYDEKAMPFVDTISNIHEGFANGQYIKLSTNELFPIVNHEGLKEKDKLIRDKAWRIIQDLVSKEPNIFKKMREASSFYKQQKNLAVRIRLFINI